MNVASRCRCNPTTRRDAVPDVGRRVRRGGARAGALARGELAPQAPRASPPAVQARRPPKGLRAAAAEFGHCGHRSDFRCPSLSLTKDERATMPELHGTCTAKNQTLRLRKNEDSFTPPKGIC